MFSCNPIFAPHPVTFHLNQYVLPETRMLHFFWNSVLSQIQVHHVCRSRNNAFECNSANFPRHDSGLLQVAKSPIIVNACDSQGKAWEVLPGLSGHHNCGFPGSLDTQRVLRGACSTAIQEASARGRLSAPLQAYWSRIWILERSLVNVFEHKISRSFQFQTNSLTTMAILGDTQSFESSTSSSGWRVRWDRSWNQLTFILKVTPSPFYWTHDSCIHFLLINSRIHFLWNFFFKLNHSGHPWWLKC